MLSGAGEEEEDDAGGAVVGVVVEAVVGDDDDLLPSGRQLPLLQLGSPPSSGQCSGRSAGRMLEDGDSDHSLGGEGDLIGLLPPPTPCGSCMLEEATDSPT